MVQKIRAAAPLNLEKARALGEELGVSYRSIIAKAKTEKVEYQKTAPASKKPRGETKAELVARVESVMGVPLDGLDKAPAQTINRLLSFAERVTASDDDVSNDAESSS